MLEKMHDNISASITNKTAYSTCSMPERRLGGGRSITVSRYIINGKDDFKREQ